MESKPDGATGPRTSLEEGSARLLPTGPIDPMEVEPPAAVAPVRLRVVPSIVEVCVRTTAHYWTELVEGSQASVLPTHPSDPDRQLLLQSALERTEHRLASLLFSGSRTQSVEDLDRLPAVDHCRVHARAQQIVPALDLTSLPRRRRRGNPSHEAGDDRRRDERAHRRDGDSVGTPT
jgi:hypothetical protein